jgi:hypothetical protein
MPDGSGKSAGISDRSTTGNHDQSSPVDSHLCEDLENLLPPLWTLASLSSRNHSFDQRGSPRQDLSQGIEFLGIDP